MSVTIMKIANYIVALVSAILLLFNISPVNPDGEQVDLSKFELVFEDEFDGTALNNANWAAHNSEGVRRGGYWAMEQVSVSDGAAHITTEYKKDGKFGAGWYTAGIATKNKFEQTYGYFECRCILPKGQGLWAAFWMTNSNVTKLTSGNATKGAEIDIFESPYYYRSANNHLVSSNIHYNGYELQTKYSNVGIWQLDNNPYENFNTYGVEWNKDGYTFYINGVKVGFSNYGGVSTEDEYMILSCEIDGTGAEPVFGWSGLITNNSADLSSDYVIDYVRAYSYK